MILMLSLYDVLSAFDVLFFFFIAARNPIRMLSTDTLCFGDIGV